MFRDLDRKGSLERSSLMRAIQNTNRSSSLVVDLVMYLPRFTHSRHCRRDQDQVPRLGHARHVLASPLNGRSPIGSIFTVKGQSVCWRGHLIRAEQTLTDLKYSHIQRNKPTDASDKRRLCGVQNLLVTLTVEAGSHIHYQRMTVARLRTHCFLS